MSESQEFVVETGGHAVTVVTGGAGRPLLMLHDELGFPGWMQWNRDLAQARRIVAPLQPGFGRTPRVEWFGDYRDVASFYNRLVREMGEGPVDVIGFSAGGWVAAEMAVAAPELVDRLVLVAPLGVRPTEGEIYDFLAATMRTHVAATVENADAEEFGTMYGGDITPEQFELFEQARAETSRLGWEPFMFSPSLPFRLAGATVPTLVLWGDADRIVPRSAMDRYVANLPDAQLEVMAGVGHRPEIEDPTHFVKVVGDFLTNDQKEA
jgi:pimeloyl-ACP methyl ester carboxylesterase